MFLSLALAVLTTAPAQGGALKLTNVRTTFGELGGPRPTTRILPGDMLYLGYDINGLTIDADGKATYKMAMEVVDGAGKSIFKQDPVERIDIVPLRGNIIPARAFINIGLDQDPGSYTCKITVEDPKTKAKDSLAVKFDVLKRDFGIVWVYPSHDELGRLPAPTTGLVGQTLFIKFQIVTFERDAKTQQPNVEIETQILDDKGMGTLAQPWKYVQDNKAVPAVKENAGAFPVGFAMFLNRPGKFTVRMTATDKVSNKKATFDLPITVLPAS